MKALKATDPKKAAKEEEKLLQKVQGRAPAFKSTLFLLHAQACFAAVASPNGCLTGAKKTHHVFESLENTASSKALRLGVGFAVRSKVDAQGKKIIYCHGHRCLRCNSPDIVALLLSYCKAPPFYEFNGTVL